MQRNGRVLAVVLSAASVACGSQGTTICEKTLVAWVSLQNTTQRGGIALTLIDGHERFDEVVFGEKAPGKWMAGSDFFRRTRNDQSSYPAEFTGRSAAQSSRNATTPSGWAPARRGNRRTTRATASSS